MHIGCLHQRNQLLRAHFFKSELRDLHSPSTFPLLEKRPCFVLFTRCYHLGAWEHFLSSPGISTIAVKMNQRAFLSVYTCPVAHSAAIVPAKSEKSTRFRTVVWSSEREPTERWPSGAETDILTTFLRSEVVSSSLASFRVLSWNVHRRSGIISGTRIQLRKLTFASDLPKLASERTDYFLRATSLGFPRCLTSQRLESLFWAIFCFLLFFSFFFSFRIRPRSAFLKRHLFLWLKAAVSR